MSDPIITGLTTSFSGASCLILIEGQGFDASTRFSVEDVANPQVVWNPKTQPCLVSDGGTRARFTSTPSIPGGGPLPTSGNLRISSFPAGVITPTAQAYTKTFPYQGTFTFTPAAAH